MPKSTLKVPLGQPTLNQKKTKLKLVKTMKTEQRKASFPWDFGLLFGKPMRRALIAGFIFYNIKKKYNA